MYRDISTVKQRDRPPRQGSAGMIPRDEAWDLLNRLQAVHILDASWSPPDAWDRQVSLPVADVAATIRQYLSKDGWHQVIAAVRHPDHAATERSLDLSDPSDFLAAVELALAQGAVAQDTPAVKETSDVPAVVAGEGTTSMAEGLPEQDQSPGEALSQPAGHGAWLLSPRALWARLNAFVMRAHATAQIDGALNDAALYSARMRATDAERDISLARIDGLRAHLRRQLKVFCEEEGLPLPKPYSREEAYLLHLLTAYFVSLAETERAVAKHGSALARRQIALEGERTEARINSQLLPELLEALYEADPLREGFLRERMRHRSALIMSGLVGGLGGAMWGLLEGALDVLVAGLIRYAPVIAPALLIGLATLVALTVSNGPPLQVGFLMQYLTRALWNTVLALGVTATAYGCWRYFAARVPTGTGRGARVKSGQVGETLVAEVVGDGTQTSRAVDAVLHGRAGNGRSADRPGSNPASGQAPS